MTSAPTTLRRGAGTVALLSALLLALTSLLLAPAAQAQDPQTCQHAHGFPDNLTGNSEGDWGSITFTSDSGPLILNVNEGYAVELCLKKSTDPILLDPFIGPIVDQEINYPDTEPGEGFSHYGVREVTIPVGTEAPTFRDPDCDDPTVGYTLPSTTGVTYTIDIENPGPGDTVTVTATANAPYVLEDDAEDSWEHTFGSIPEDCDGPEPTVVTPAASFTDPSCDDLDGAGVTTETIEGVTYTIVGDVEPGGSVEVTATIADGYALAEDATTVWTHDFADPTDCDPVTGVDDNDVVRPQTPNEPDDVDVLPNVVEKPAPTPAPAVAAQELPATGLSSTQMLLLSLLLMGLGAVMILGPQGRREY